MSSNLPILPELPAATGTGSPLPLPLSAFERYMLADDQPAHPMSSFLEIDLSGPIDQRQLLAVLPLILQRHPLLNATVDRDAAGTLVWQDWGRLPGVVLLPESGPLPNEPRFDLHQAPGCRCWWWARAGGGTLLCEVHHASCDGMGMLIFAMEWIAASQGLPLPPSSVDQLPAREDISSIRSTFPLKQSLRKVMRALLGHSPRPLSGYIVAEESSTDVNSAYLSVSLSRDELTRLRSATHQARVSINDWLAAALFETIIEWEKTIGERLPAGRWQLLVPVNRRPREFPLHSACNLLGYKLLSRTSAETRCFRTLLEGIQKEMEPVRLHPRGVLSFLKTMKVLAKMGLLHWCLQRQHNFATAILSNLGDLTQNFSSLFEVEQDQLVAGEVAIEKIRLAPPRRRGTHQAIVAQSYGGELHLIASRLGRGLSAAQTEEFLKRFRDAILRHLD